MVYLESLTAATQRPARKAQARHGTSTAVDSGEIVSIYLRKEQDKQHLCLPSPGCDAIERLSSEMVNNP
jgi:hypothetical protein